MGRGGQNECEAIAFHFLDPVYRDDRDFLQVEFFGPIHSSAGAVVASAGWGGGREPVGQRELGAGGADCRLHCGVCGRWHQCVGRGGVADGKPLGQHDQLDDSGPGALEPDAPDLLACAGDQRNGERAVERMAGLRHACGDRADGLKSGRAK